jgi:hypothetical protein
MLKDKIYVESSSSNCLYATKDTTFEVFFVLTRTIRMVLFPHMWLLYNIGKDVTTS